MDWTPEMIAAMNAVRPASEGGTAGNYNPYPSAAQMGACLAAMQTMMQARMPAGARGTSTGAAAGVTVTTVFDPDWVMFLNFTVPVVVFAVRGIANALVVGAAGLSAAAAVTFGTAGTLQFTITGNAAWNANGDVIRWFAHEL